MLRQVEYRLEFTPLAKGFVQTIVESLAATGAAVYKKNGHHFSLIAIRGYVFDEGMPKTIASAKELSDDATVASDNQHALVLQERGEIFGVVVLRFGKQEKRRRLAFIEAFHSTIEHILIKGFRHEMQIIEGKRRELLLQVTKKVHSTMNIDEVLAEIVSALEQMYPAFQINLLLSHEWPVRQAIPVKPFKYGDKNGNQTAEKAYLDGTLQKEEMNEHVWLYVPLRGKQGSTGLWKSHLRTMSVFLGMKPLLSRYWQIPPEMRWKMLSFISNHGSSIMIFS